MTKTTKAARFEDLSDEGKARLAAVEARFGVTREERVAHTQKFFATVRNNWRA